MYLLCLRVGSADATLVTPDAPDVSTGRVDDVTMGSEAARRESVTLQPSASMKFGNRNTGIAVKTSAAQETKGKDEKILALIQERKSTAKTEKEKISDISKKIKKCIRDNQRTKRQENTHKILEEVKGTRNISSVKSVKKRILIPKIKNKEGEAIRTRQGITNVFAKFYEDLHEGEEGYTEEGMDSRTEDDKTDPGQHNSIPEFTKNEIQDAIDRL